MTKIAIFYHVYQYGDWENVFKEQIDKLKKSLLFDIADFIYIGVSGEEILPMTQEDYDRIDVIQRIYGEDKKQGEAPTLRSLYEFCKNKQDNWNVLFLHAKGVTWSLGDKKKLYVSSVDELEEIWSNVNNPKNKLLTMDCYKNIIKWRNYIEFFLIEKWRTCVNKLNVPSLLTQFGTYQTFDTVGTEWLPYFAVNELGSKEAIGKLHDFGHYSGNMWWANSSYIKTLDWNFVENTNYFFGGKIEGRRFLSEAWIGLGKPVFYNFHNTNRDLYINAIEEYEYRNRFMLNNKNTATNGRICMISMFKNEAAGIGRMLESVSPYIDFWVLQDNGSTDGTPQIVEEWAKKHNIPGFMYKCEEGWIGYGWNRDHVLQKALQANHNCDWIMKMDCDEALEVDDDFNWNELNDHSTHAYSVHAKAPGCQYFRTWIWRSDLPWRFNHDPAHETIYLDNEYGHNYSTKNLGLQFKMLAGGKSTGESHQNPAKYALDALKLEEKLIRENSMLENMYHFFYVGKSYEDSMPNKLPLGINHTIEMARRTIFYFSEWLERREPGFMTTYKRNNPESIDEMGYYACNVLGVAHRVLGEHYKAIEWWERTEQFVPSRNDHLVNMAETYWELMDYKKMLQVTTRLMHPDRKNPFPSIQFAVSQHYYHDTGTHVKFLHEQAIALNEQFTPMGSLFAMNRNPRKKLWVVDNFYEDPYALREFALKQDFNDDLRFYKGKRTANVYHTPQIKQRFEEIMGVKIREFPGDGTMNGVFQYCTPEDLLVHHHDTQTWAAMVFLTPDAPFETGTSFYRHKQTGITLADPPKSDVYSMHGFYDRTKFELIDQIGNVFNRLVIFDARCLHSATQYFGTKKEDARLFHIFFFD
jgi:glycosyltransferase involved in cell wall biosynthesis